MEYTRPNHKGEEPQVYFYPLGLKHWNDREWEQVPEGSRRSWHSMTAVRTARPPKAYEGAGKRHVGYRNPFVPNYVGGEAKYDDEEAEDSEGEKNRLPERFGRSRISEAEDAKRQEKARKREEARESKRMEDARRREEARRAKERDEARKAKDREYQRAFNNGKLSARFGRPPQQPQQKAGAPY